jgi:hypothetical protein
MPPRKATDEHQGLPISLSGQVPPLQFNGFKESGTVASLLEDPNRQRLFIGVAVVAKTSIKHEPGNEEERPILRFVHLEPVDDAEDAATIQHVLGKNYGNRLGADGQLTLPFPAGEQLQPEVKGGDFPEAADESIYTGAGAVEGQAALEAGPGDETGGDEAAEIERLQRERRDPVTDYGGESDGSGSESGEADTPGVPAPNFTPPPGDDGENGATPISSARGGRRRAASSRS